MVFERFKLSDHKCVSFQIDGPAGGRAQELQLQGHQNLSRLTPMEDLPMTQGQYTDDLWLICGTSTEDLLMIYGAPMGVLGMIY